MFFCGQSLCLQAFCWKWIFLCSLRWWRSLSNAYTCCSYFSCLEFCILLLRSVQDLLWKGIFAKDQLIRQERKVDNQISNHQLEVDSLCTFKRRSDHLDLSLRECLSKICLYLGIQLLVLQCTQVYLLQFYWQMCFWILHIQRAKDRFLGRIDILCWTPFASWLSYEQDGSFLLTKTYRESGSPSSKASFLRFFQAARHYLSRIYPSLRCCLVGQHNHFPFVLHLVA